jgi:RNA polymerase sigma-70 factor (ECF subfamily)
MIDVRETLEPHRPALTGHCYRMLGSAVEADDAVQETMLRAWKGWASFDQRSSVSTWLYRIATNVCLDELRSRKRRELPTQEGSPGTVDDELTRQPRSHWLEPVPDALALPPESQDGGP